ncbi:MAG: sulfatase, partial [Chromatiales bacterium]|nr:sulfatase [Chromatiales bacterium]
RDPAHTSIVAVLEEQLRDIVDPEAVDREAQAAQVQLVNSHGGPEAVMQNLVTASSYTPVPEELLT